MPFTEIFLFIVATVIQQLLAPRPPKPKPAALTDFDVLTADAGRPVPVVFGTVLVKGSNIVWFGDLRSTPIKSGGGKK